MTSKQGGSEVKGLLRPKKYLDSGNPTDPPVLPATQICFRHNLHSVKIGVSQAPFRLHSIVSVQRQYGYTGAQVNHVVFYFSNVRIGDRYSRKCSDIIAGCITFTKYKGQFCNTVPSVSLFKVQKRRIPSCLCT